MLQASLQSARYLLLKQCAECQVPHISTAGHGQADIKIADHAMTAYHILKPVRAQQDVQSSSLVSAGVRHAHDPSCHLQMTAAAMKGKYRSIKRDSMPQTPRLQDKFAIPLYTRQGLGGGLRQ